MGLFENMSQEPVQTLNLRRPVVVKPNDTIRAAVESMRERRLGCAILVDKREHPVGMLTESMLTQLIAQNPEAIEQPVKEHAAENWPWVKLSDPILDVLEALEAKNVRFLCVVDDKGRLAGLTGQKGLMEYIADHFPHQVMVQRVGQAPYLHEREGA